MGKWAVFAVIRFDSVFDIGVIVRISFLVALGILYNAHNGRKGTNPGHGWLDK